LHGPEAVGIHQPDQAGHRVGHRTIPAALITVLAIGVANGVKARAIGLQCGAGWALGAGWAGIAFITFQTDWALIAFQTLWTGRASIAFITFQAGYALIAFRTLWTGRAGITFRTLGTGWTG